MESKHSKKGIASFVMALLIVLGLLTIVCFQLNVPKVPAASVSAARWYESREILGKMWFCLYFAINPIAFILGLAGMLDRDRKRIYAVLGVLLTWLIVFAVSYACLCCNYL